MSPSLRKRGHIGLRARLNCPVATRKRSKIFQVRLRLVLLSCCQQGRTCHRTGCRLCAPLRAVRARTLFGYVVQTIQQTFGRFFCLAMSFRKCSKTSRADKQMLSQLSAAPRSIARGCQIFVLLGRLQLSAPALTRRAHSRKAERSMQRLVKPCIPNRERTAKSQ